MWVNNDLLISVILSALTVASLEVVSPDLIILPSSSHVTVRTTSFPSFFNSSILLLIPPL